MNEFSRFIDNNLEAILSQKHETIIQLIELIENQTHQFVDALSSHTIKPETAIPILLIYIKNKEEYSFVFNPIESNGESALRRVKFADILGVLPSWFLAKILTEIISQSIHGRNSVFEHLCSLSIQQTIHVLSALTQIDLITVLVYRMHLRTLLTRLFDMQFDENYAYDELIKLLDHLPWDLILTASQPIFDKIETMRASYENTLREDPLREDLSLENQAETRYQTHYQESLENYLNSLNHYPREDLQNYINKREREFIHYLNTIKILVLSLEHPQLIYRKPSIQVLIKNQAIQNHRNEHTDFGRFWQHCMVMQRNIIQHGSAGDTAMLATYSQIFADIQSVDDEAVVPCSP